MRRKGVLTGVWLLATLAATLVAWAAVRQVTAEVSPSRTLPFPSGVALADGVTEPPPGLSSVPPASPADQDGAGGAEPAVTQAYSLTGGVVTVRYRGSTTTLVSATPNSGFGVEVNDAGPEKVDVRFRADEHESRFAARIRDGVPDPQTEERPR